jgi:hypothetical protein
VEWNFDEPQPDWKPLRSEGAPSIEPMIEQADGVLRVSLDGSNEWLGGPNLQAAIYVDLPDWRREDWDHLLIRARSSPGVRGVNVAFNVGDRTIPGRDDVIPVQFLGIGTPVFSDGAVHTYRLRADWSRLFWGEWKDPWRQLVLTFFANEPSQVEVLSITAVSKAAEYGEARAGVEPQDRRGDIRQALYMHAPGSLSYRVEVPAEGRLGFGLGVLTGDPLHLVSSRNRCSKRPLAIEIPGLSARWIWRTWPGRPWTWCSRWPRNVRVRWPCGVLLRSAAIGALIAPTSSCTP